MSQTYPNHRAVLMDKGYKSASEFLRVILPKKNPPNRTLSKEDIVFNRKVASDRIIVED